MDEKVERLGLVLSGGGARGAYEVGVARYLADQHISPDVYSGASIGSLNAAFLASAKTIQDGSRHLLDIWQSIEKEKIIMPNNKDFVFGLFYSMLRRSSRNSPEIARIKTAYFETVERYFNSGKYLNFIETSPFPDFRNNSVFDNAPLRTLIEEEIGLPNLDKAKPLWISLFPTDGIMQDLVSLGLAETGIIDSKDSHYLLMQQLPKEERINALLASAAIPLLFESQTIQGREYVDGGLGNWMEGTGNTPITPILQTGCEWCIVVHLVNGSTWDRNKYQNCTIIEVRPEKDIHPEGQIKSLLHFEPDRIGQWIEQGYEDAQRCIGNCITALKTRSLGYQARKERDDSIARLNTDNFKSSINKLKK